MGAGGGRWADGRRAIPGHMCLCGAGAVAAAPLLAGRPAGHALCHVSCAPLLHAPGSPARGRGARATPTSVPWSCHGLGGRRRWDRGRAACAACAWETAATAAARRSISAITAFQPSTAAAVHAICGPGSDARGGVGLCGGGAARGGSRLHGWPTMRVPGAGLLDRAAADVLMLCAASLARRLPAPLHQPACGEPAAAWCRCSAVHGPLAKQRAPPSRHQPPRQAPAQPHLKVIVISVAIVIDRAHQEHLNVRRLQREM